MAELNPQAQQTLLMNNIAMLANANLQSYGERDVTSIDAREELANILESSLTSIPSSYNTRTTEEYTNDSVMYVPMGGNYGYTNFTAINVRNPELIVSQLSGKTAKIKALFSASPAELSALVPVIRLFKLVSTGDNVETEEEIVLPDYTLAISTETDQYNLAGREGGLGVQDFVWEHLASHYGDIESNFRSTLTLFFQNFSDFAYSSGTIRDLCLQNVSTSYRLKVVVGWSVPEGDYWDSNPLNPDFIDAVRDLKTVLIMSMIDHKLKFTQEGTIKLVLEYQAALVGTLSGVDADLMYGFLMDVSLVNALNESMGENRGINLAQTILQVIATHQESIESLRTELELESTELPEEESEWTTRQRLLSSRRAAIDETLHQVRNTLQSRLYTIGQNYGTVAGTEELDPNSSVMRNLRDSMRMPGTFVDANGRTWDDATKSIMLGVLESQTNSSEAAAFFSSLNASGIIEGDAPNATAEQDIEWLRNLVNVIKTFAFNKIITNMLDNGRLFYVDVSTEGPNDVPYIRNVTPHPVIPIHVEGVAGEEFVEQDIDVAEETFRQVRDVLSSSISGGDNFGENVARLTSNDRIKFFYYGDFLDTILGLYYRANNNIDRFGVLMSTLVYKQHDNMDRLQRHSVPICDIPISLPLFVQWFAENFVATENMSFPIAEVISRSLNELIVSALNGPHSVYHRTPQINIFNTTIYLPQNSAGGDILNQYPTSVEHQPRLQYEDFARLRENYSEGSNNLDLSRLKTYMLIYATELVVEDLRSDQPDSIERDLHNGIYWFYIGSDKGILKSIEFQEETQEYLREARLANEGRTGWMFNVYKASLTFVGNPIFVNGQIIYIDPSIVGVGSTSDSGETLARMLNLGGYFQIVKVENAIDFKSGKFETIVEAKWIASGGPSEQEIEQRRQEQQEIEQQITAEEDAAITRESITLRLEEDMIAAQDRETESRERAAELRAEADRLLGMTEGELAAEGLTQDDVDNAEDMAERAEEQAITDEGLARDAESLANESAGAMYSEEIIETPVPTTSETTVDEQVQSEETPIPTLSSYRPRG